MKQKMWFLLAVISVLCFMVAVASATPPASALKKARVGLILPSPISDPAWSGPAYEGLQDSKNKFGVEISHVENVQPPEFEDSFREYAARGFDLVIGHGDQFMETVLKVAPDYPKTHFVVISYPVPKFPSNISIFTYNHAETGFMNGVISSMVTKANKIGGVGGVDSPLTRRGLEAIQEGVKWAGSPARVMISWIGDWNDMAKGKETTLALIALGCDVIVYSANLANIGILEAVREKGLVGVGKIPFRTAPDVLVATVYWNHKKTIAHIVELFINGKLEAKRYIAGMKDGLVVVDGFGARLLKRMSIRLLR